MPYIFLALAIVFEVVGTSLLKLSDGFTRLWPTLGVAAGYGVAFWMLSLTLRSVPVGIAYAIWAGLGTALIAVIGSVVFGESLGPVKITGIVLIVAGVVALNIDNGAH
ncbi:DMT family transporter [Arthrobacter castelli]|uniref:DMT family transporter n=1 Tax=Arthrobacter castelli TaxID=271431 RepID=UPI0003FF9FD2|nr:multidrug efflux SMR transporter [Arthrobacter castelli]